MSRFLKGTALAALTLTAAAPAFADGYGLGREALPEEIAAWNLDIAPDGTGLPDGSGSVEDGEWIFSENCAGCHGEVAVAWIRRRANVSLIDRFPGHFANRSHIVRARGHRNERFEFGEINLIM